MASALVPLVASALPVPPIHRARRFTRKCGELKQELTFDAYAVRLDASLHVCRSATWGIVGVKSRQPIRPRWPSKPSSGA